MRLSVICTPAIYSCKKNTTKQDYQLIMVDGFGNSDFVMICDYSRVLHEKEIDEKVQTHAGNI